MNKWIWPIKLIIAVIILSFIAWGGYKQRMIPPTVKAMVEDSNSIDKQFKMEIQCPCGNKMSIEMPLMNEMEFTCTKCKAKYTIKITELEKWKRLNLEHGLSNPK